MAIASILDRLDRCLGLLAAGHGAIPQFLPEFRGAIAALKGLPYAWRLRERSLVNDLEIAAASLEEDCAPDLPAVLSSLRDFLRELRQALDAGPDPAAGYARQAVGMQTAGIGRLLQPSTADRTTDDFPRFGLVLEDTHARTLTRTTTRPG